MNEAEMNQIDREECDWRRQQDTLDAQQESDMMDARLLIIRFLWLVEQGMGTTEDVRCAREALKTLGVKV
jgi:hypothetical protein